MRRSVVVAVAVAALAPSCFVTVDESLLDRADAAGPGGDAGANDAPAGDAAPSPLGQTGAFTLEFDDEFDGTALDPAGWVPCYPWGTTAGCGDDSTSDTWYAPANDRVAEGMLQIVAEAKLLDAGARTYHYASGIATTGAYGTTPYHHTFDRGYFEVRLRPPAPSNGVRTLVGLHAIGARYPPAIEIAASDGTTSDELQFGFFYTNDAGARATFTTSTTGLAASADFHVVGMSWEADRIAWFVDGVPTGKIFNQPAYVADEPMYLTVGLSVGDNASAPVDGTTMFPSTLRLDYVRVWSR